MVFPQGNLRRRQLSLGTDDVRHYVRGVQAVEQSFSLPFTQSVQERLSCPGRTVARPRRADKIVGFHSDCHTLGTLARRCVWPPARRLFPPLPFCLNRAQTVCGAVASVGLDRTCGQRAPGAGQPRTSTRPIGQKMRKTPTPGGNHLAERRGGSAI